MQHLKRLLSRQEDAIIQTERELSQLAQQVFNDPSTVNAVEALRDRLEKKLDRQREAHATTILRIKIATADADPQQLSHIGATVKLPLEEKQEGAPAEAEAPKTPRRRNS